MLYMFSAEKEAGLKRDAVQICPDSLLYRKKWVRAIIHTKLLKTQRVLMEKQWEVIFSSFNPKGDSHFYISVTAKMEKLYLQFRPLSHAAWLGAHFAL